MMEDKDPVGVHLGRRGITTGRAIAGGPGLAALAVLAHVLVVARAACATDWPHWRGPTRNDITAENSGWRDGRWLKGGPAWARSVGDGATSPVVAGKRLYVMGNSNGADSVYCLSAADGSQIWKKSYPCRKYGRHATGDQRFYAGPSSTPEYDATTGYLYTLSIDGHLNCWDTGKGGKRVWGLNLYDRFGVDRRPSTGGDVRDYGYTSSPLVWGRVVIVEVGDDTGNLMAFDKATGGDPVGKPVWTSDNADHAGHTGGPVPITVGGKPCLAVLTLDRLLVVKLDAGHEGETVAAYDWLTPYANNVPTPTVLGSKVVLTSGYVASKTVMLSVTPAGISADWVSKGHYSKVCSPVIHNGHVYLVLNTLRCLDSAGNLKWQGGSLGNDASLVLTVDKRLLLFGARGKVGLVETAERSPTYKELAIKRTGASADNWPHIVVDGGRLYCKDRKGRIECYLVGPPAPASLRR